MRRDFDVVVVGGAMVGGAVAALLAAHSGLRQLRIALIEPQPATLPAATDDIDLRVIALSRASERLLRGVGAWAPLQSRSPCAYERMVVWDQGDVTRRQALSFDAAELGEADLGHIAESRSVAAALLGVALGSGVVLLRSPLASLERLPEGARVHLADGRTIDTGLVVAADGAESQLRSAAAIEVTGWAYEQHAVVAHLQPQQSHRHTAWQCFHATGPIAYLPLSDGRVSIVWSTTPAQAEHLLALDDVAFGAAVAAATGEVLGSMAAAGPRARFPLRMQHAKTYAAARLVLVGDAAHTVHPLAGQGANLGLLDAAALVAVLAAAIAAGEDPGDMRVLGRYSRWRRAENLQMMAGLEGLHRLFTNDNPALATLRRSGFALVQRSGPAKRAFMRRAMGLDEDVTPPTNDHRNRA